MVICQSYRNCGTSENLGTGLRAPMRRRTDSCWCCSGCGPMGVNGTKTHAPMQRCIKDMLCYDGHGPTDVRVTRSSLMHCCQEVDSPCCILKNVPRLSTPLVCSQKMGICQSYRNCGESGNPGTSGRVLLQQKKETFWCCSGCRPTGVRGTRGRACMQHGGDICRCCSGRGPTGALSSNNL